MCVCVNECVCEREKERECVCVSERVSESETTDGTWVVSGMCV